MFLNPGYPGNFSHDKENTIILKISAYLINVRLKMANKLILDLCKNT